MKCPTDDTLLVMSERHGIEIDYCPQCRGVWLDRGELDKIIDRAGAPANASTASTASSAPRVDLPRDVPSAGQPSGAYPPGGFAQPGYGQRWGSHSPGSAPRYDRYGAQPGYPRQRQRNWLSELFD